MSEAADEPQCPECGGPIGQRATYCMHCSADLTDRTPTAGDDGSTAQSGASVEPVGSDGDTDGPVGGPTDTLAATLDTLGITGSDDGDDAPLLDPDGLVDNTLTVVIGIAGGIVVGLVGTVVLLVLTRSGWAILFGLLTWLGSTAYLVRRRTVQGAISKTGYAVAIVLLSVPVVALSPLLTVDSSGERGGLLAVLFMFVAIPAGLAAVIGWAAGRFVPEPDPAAESEG